jgi:hypothetical protein
VSWSSNITSAHVMSNTSAFRRAHLLLALLGMRRILGSPRLPRHLPLSTLRRDFISISLLKPRGSAPNSSLTVNSGLNNIENIFSNRPTNPPSNNSPNKNSSDTGKHLLQVFSSSLTRTLRSPDASTAVSKACRLWCAAWGRPSDSNYPNLTRST